MYMYLQSVHCSGILFFRPALQALYLHIGAKAFLKEHFLNTSISTRYSIKYFAVLEYMLYNYLVEKLVDENENAPLEKTSPHCVMLISSLHLILKELHLRHFYADIAAKYLDRFPLISK